MALAVLCLAAFIINLDTTIVNIALPSLVRQLDASTRELQWVVDAYTLTFAALVLAAGSLGDRYGRKGALLTGLVVFGSATAVGGLVDSSGALIAVRAVMGVGAALIFPATLAIIANLYTERGERARAIGLWGAMTGLGVALGPITGGWLLEHFWWGSVFVAMAPVAAVTLLGGVLFVPTSRDPATPPVDVGGLALSTVAIGTLVFTIIEAPERGWTSPATVVGFALAAAATAVFVAWERRRAHPMLDVSLFRNLRFSAASGSIMTIFFALAGFVFLITQYFQFLKGYAPFSTGLRILPVAICIAIGSVVGVRLSVTVGNKAVVATGLTLVSVSFAWVSTASTATPYIEIVGQMVLAGIGMGLTTAPATEAIMGVVPKEKAGIGSAVNDATRELGATLGVAIIGSIYASRYASGIQDAAGTLPAPALDTATDSIGAALTIADQLGPAGQTLLEASQAAFFDGFQVGCLVAASVLIAGAVFAARFLPSRPSLTTTPETNHRTRPRNGNRRGRRRRTWLLLGSADLVLLESARTRQTRPGWQPTFIVCATEGLLRGRRISPAEVRRHEEIERATEHDRRRDMTLEAPVTELDSRFSSPGAMALPWREAEQRLQTAEVYWLSTMRPDGRPHVAPLIAVWLDGALYFCTGDTERKARNLAENLHVAITTGHNALREGLDLVVEGEAVVVSDGAKVRRVADAYAAKYGEGWRIAGLDGVLTFEVTPATAFGFGREDAKSPPPGGGFNQTRWRFGASPAATGRRR